MAVIGYDFPGHGLSNGKKASINDFFEYQILLKNILQWVEFSNLPKYLYLFGQSTGGAILIDYLLNNNNNNIEKIILFNPLVRPHQWKINRYLFHCIYPFFTKIPRKFSLNSNDRVFLKFLKKDPLQSRYLSLTWVSALDKWIKRIEKSNACKHSLILVQGELDKTVDYKFNYHFLMNHFLKIESLFIPNAKHHLANEILSIRNEYFKFLDRLCF